MFPLVGDGGGVMSFIHLDDAAAATVLVREHDEPAAAPDGMEGGHPGVGQGRRGDGVERPRPHELASRHDDVVRHASVLRDPDRSRDHVAAHVVLPAPARRTAPTADQLVDGDPRPDRLVADLGADRDDLAGDLVAEHHRKRERTVAAGAPQRPGADQITTTEEVVQIVGGGQELKVTEEVLDAEPFGMTLREPLPRVDNAFKGSEHGAYTHIFQEILLRGVIGDPREFFKMLSYVTHPADYPGMVKPFWARLYEALFDSFVEGSINRPEAFGPVLRDHLGLRVRPPKSS